MAKIYIVTVTVDQDWRGPQTSELEIVANDRNEAIKRARREMADAGYFASDGPISYRARVSDKAAPVVATQESKPETTDERIARMYAEMGLPADER